MKFYINKGNILPLPTGTAIYSEAVRLEKLFTQRWPYPSDIFTVIYNRTKRCEALLWYYGDHDTSYAIKHKLDTFFKGVQNVGAIVGDRVYGNAELALFMDKQKTKISKDKK